MSDSTGLKLLYNLSSDEATSKKLLNQTLNALKSQIKDSPLNMDMDISKILKKLSHVRLEYDKTGQVIQKINATMRMANGQTFTSTLGVNGENVSKMGFVENKNADTLASTYLKRVKQIVAVRKQLSTLKSQQFITEADIKFIERYEKRLDSLSKSMNKKLTRMQKSDYDYSSQIKLGQYALEDADLFDAKKQKQLASKQETSKLQDQNKFLKEYEQTQKRIITLQKSYWDEEAKANSNTFKNTKESKDYRLIANKLLQDEIKTARQKEALAKNDPVLMQKTMEMNSKYRAESERLYALSKSQYSLNKGFFKDMMSGWKDATARIINYTVIYRSVWGLIQGFQNAVSTIQELNKAFTDIQMVTGYNDQQIQQLSASYVQLAKDMGATVTQVAQGATEWLRQGKTTAETSSLLKQSLILSKVGAMESAEATEYLTSTLNGYKMEVADASRVVDVFSKLDMSAATSSKELAIAFSRTANSASDAGMGFEELAGYITTVSETTRRSASTIGEAFKTIFARLQNVKVGKLIDDETGENINDTESALASLGIQLRKSPTEWRKASDVLMEVGKNWKNYNQLQKNTIVTSLAGTRQAEILRSAFNNFDKVLGYTEEAYDSTGTSAQKYGTYLDSIEAKQNKLVSTFQEIAYQPGFEELYKQVLDLATLFGDFLNTISSSPSTIALFTGALALAVTPKVISTLESATTGFANFGVALQSIGVNAKTGMKYVSQSGDDIIRMLNALTPAQQLAFVAQDALSKKQIDSIMTNEALANAEVKQALAVKSMAIANGTATVSTQTLGLAWKGLLAELALNPFVWITGAILLVYALAKAWDYFNVTFEENVEQLNKLKGEYDEIGTKITELTTTLEKNQERLNDLRLNPDFTSQQEKEITNLEAQNVLLEEQIALQTDLKAEKQKAVGEQALKTVNTKNIASYTSQTGTPSQTPIYLSPIDMVKKSVEQEEIASKRIIELDKQRGKVQQDLAKARANDERTYGLSSQIERLSADIARENKVIDEAKTVQGKYNTTLLEVASSLDLNDAKQKQAYKTIVGLIEKQKELNSVGTETSTPELTEQEKLQKSYEAGDIILSEYIAKMKDLNKTSSAYVDKIREVTSAQTYLNDISDKVGKSQSLTKDEMEELVKVYPSLEGAIYRTADGWSVEKTALDLLNTSVSGLNMAYQTAQNAMTAISVANALERIGITEAEIASVQSLASAYALYSGAVESIPGVYEKDAKMYYGNDANTGQATGFKKALLDLGKAKEEIAKLEKGIGGYNTGAIKDKSSGGSNPSAIGEQDLASAFVKGANEDVNKLKKQAESIENQIKLAKKAKDYTKELELQNELLKNQADTVVALQVANAKISQEASRLRSNSKYGAQSAGWFDVNGEASAEYTKLLESFAGKTDAVSKKAYDDITTLFEALYKLKQGWYTNTDAVLNFKDAMDATQASMNDIKRDMYEAEQKALESLLEMTRNLIKQEKEDEKDALDDKLDSYKEMIDLKKKELELTAQLYTYNKNLASKQQEIAKTEAKLLEIKFDDSASANAQRLTLEEQLAQQKLDLEEMQTERSTEIQQDALDEQLDAYQEEIEDAKEEIDDFLDNVALLTEEAYDRINDSTGDFYDELIAWNLQYGDGLRSTVVDTWEDAYDAMEKYKNSAGEIDYGNAIDNVNDGLEDTETGDGTNESLIQATVDKMKANSTAWISASSQAEKDMLANLNQSLGKSIGANYVSSEGKWYLNGKPLYEQYHQGGVVGGVKLKSSEEFAKLLKGEVVSTQPQMQNFMNKVLPQIVSRASDSTNSIGDISMIFNIAGNLDKAVLPDIRKVADNTLDRINTSLKNKGITRSGKNFSL